MALWQTDIVGGFAVRIGAFANCLNRVDDHSRLRVSAKLMGRERSRGVGRFGAGFNSFWCAGTDFDA